MSIQTAKSVNFGTNKTGLSTIGYTLYNSDRSLNRARSITGIGEVLAGTGIYGGTLTLDDNWQGFILWDTGDSDIYYAEENFDYRQYSSGGSGSSGGGGYVIAGGGKDIWTEEEKKKIISKVNKIFAIVDLISKKSIAAIVESLQAIQDQHGGNILELTRIQEKMIQVMATDNKDIALINESLGDVCEALAALIEYKQVENILGEVDDVKD